MIPALEADTYAFWRGFARRPGGRSGSDGGATWFCSGVPFLNYNGILGAGPDVGVDAMLAHVREWRVPSRWMVCDSNVPDGCEASFAKSGLTLVDEAPGMVARIQDLRAPALPAMAVEVVSDETLFDVWLDIFRDAFGLTSEGAAHVRSAHVWPCLNDNDRRYFVMRKDKEAVATGLLHLSSKNVAGVYGIAVRRAFQKRGLGALATMLTVREGARAGADIAVLQATREGFPVYERLGFRTVCSFRSWKIT